MGERSSARREKPRTSKPTGTKAGVTEDNPSNEIKSHSPTFKPHLAQARL